MSIIDDYLKMVDPEERVELERIRAIIHELVPDVQEVKTYGMPGFKYKDKYLVAFAAFKDHLSLFPTSKPVDLLKDELKDFVASKGTIRFTLNKTISRPLLEKIIHIRLADIK